MKTSTFCTLILLLLNCFYTAAQSELSFPNPGNNDEIVILYSEESDTFKYSKEELNLILKKYPELDMTQATLSYSPKEAYLYSSNKGIEDEGIRYDFFSEVGQDEYYIIYSYFLRKKNGEEKYKELRQRLTNIYRTINNTFAELNHGGTFYGHQHRRIVGVVEYSIYLQVGYEDYYEKKYDFNAQKKIYIQLLKQVIKDEVSIDDEILDEERIARENKLLKEIQELDKLITNYYDLKCAQKFQYSNYSY